MSTPVALPTRNDVVLAGRRLLRDTLHFVSERRHALFGLAVLRIGYGAVLLGLLLVNYADRTLLWGPASPWTNDILADALAESGSFSIYQLSASTGWFEICFHLTIVVAALFMMGWRTRIVTPLLFALVWSLQERNPMVLDGGDNLMRIILVYVCFAQLSARWSMDARRLRSREKADAGATNGRPHPTLRWRLATVVHNAAVLAVLIQVAILYVASGLYKAQGERWQQGTAVYYILRVEEFQPWADLSGFVFTNVALVTISTYAAVLLQIAFPLLLLNRITRRLALVGVTGMHLGVAVLMGLPFFSAIMIITDAVFLRDRTYETAIGLVRAGRARWAARGSRMVAPQPAAPHAVDGIVLTSPSLSAAERTGIGS